MATCKDCLHVDVCGWSYLPPTAEQCVDFKDKAKYVKIGENEPLTLDELRQMDGEPAYFVSLRDGFSAWGIVHVVNMSQSWFIAVSGCERAFGDRDSYGTAWIGYRHKPKEAE